MKGEGWKREKGGDGRDGERRDVGGWRKEGWGGIEEGGMGRDRERRDGEGWSGVEGRREGEQSSLT